MRLLRFQSRRARFSYCDYSSIWGTGWGNGFNLGERDFLIVTSGIQANQQARIDRFNLGERDFLIVTKVTDKIHKQMFRVSISASEIFLL